MAWDNESAPTSAHVAFFWEHLSPHIQSWKGKTVFEIGSGTGWLLDRLPQYGVANAMGCEPSKKNCEEAKRLYPTVVLAQKTFESWKVRDGKFDRILAVMSFHHIRDLFHAFYKIKTMLERGGEAVIVVPDYDYSRQERHGYVINVCDIDERSYVVEVTRETGTIADYVAKTELYAETAKDAGLQLLEDFSMMPTERQIELRPTYEQFRNVPITRLLRFGLIEK
ncbi:MAG: class I SAM-dependent methyltransferase [bacterium]